MNDILQPMLASLADAPLDDPAARLRTQVRRHPGDCGDRAERQTVRLWSRLGNEKTRQFPEIAAALGEWARRRTQPLVLDGEIVALDAKGEPTGFQNSRDASILAAAMPTRRAARVRAEHASRRRLPTRFASPSSPSTSCATARPTSAIGRCRAARGARTALQPHRHRRYCASASRSRGDGRALYKEALARGWEGLIAKHADSLYKSGKRTPDWRKLKIVHEQEFVIGGWTEPRQTRAYFGALLLGVYEGADLVYVGHTGTGFNERELARVMKLLKPLEIDECPFKNRPKTNERPHWVRPELVAQIKFTEWTADAKLRHPVYLGLRDDKKPREVRREEDAARAARDLRRQRGGRHEGEESSVLGTSKPARTPSDGGGSPRTCWTSSRRSKRHARTASSSCPTATA